MIAELTNHLWQSTIFAMVAAVVTLTLRKNRAQVRYWVWLCASVKFLVPFALLVSLGGVIQFPSTQAVATQIAIPVVSNAIEEIAQPFPAVLSASAESAGVDWVMLALFGVWACGFIAIAVVRFRAWLLVRAAVRSSATWGFAPASLCSRVTGVDVRCSGGLLEPGVVGLFRPVLLLPAGIEEHLTAPQLKAVLTHELCHVRRRDNLTSAVHMVVEAVFWFHPLVWWVGARMLDERERACDEEVVRLGNDPANYAEGILNICKRYVEFPLGCVSGVTGSDIKRRIEAIMASRHLLQLNSAKKIVLTIAGSITLALPIMIGVLEVPATFAQSKAQPKGSKNSIPKFEVASIRPCKPDEPNPAGAKGTFKAELKGGGAPGPAPGRINRCATVAELIPQAYVLLAKAESQGTLQASIPLEGGPAWVRTDYYQINAKAEGTPTFQVMAGPMTQALLEDRFKLKIRRETREVPVYAITKVNGSKLKPVKGTCTKVPPPSRPVPGQVSCGPQGATRKGSNMIWGFVGTPNELAKILTSWMDRPVVDRSGISGLYEFRLEFAPDETSPGFRNRMQSLTDQGVATDPATGPSIFTAVQEQLGLRLERAKGPSDFLVIDQIERPSEN